MRQSEEWINIYKLHHQGFFKIHFCFWIVVRKIICLFEDWKLYYMCVDINNGSAAVNLKGVSPLFKNYSKTSKIPSPLPSPFKQCCISPSKKFGLDKHKIQWGIALFSNNIPLRGESLNILFLELIIYYSEDSWNNSRLCRVGDEPQHVKCKMQCKLRYSQTTLFWGEGRKICCCGLSL